jgi:hypothetical protein
MSGEQPTNASLAPLTREELLNALDADIAAVTSERSAVGWTFWAILGALAALLWLGIDRWDKGQFTSTNVLLLTLALSITWDTLRVALSSLDASPIYTSPATNRFRPWTRLFASARSAIIFFALKQASFITALLFLKWRISWPAGAFPLLVATFSLHLFACLLILTISLVDFPAMPDSAFKPRTWLQRALSAVATALSLFAPVACWGVVWLNSSNVTTYDTRMALICAALLHLLGLAIETSIPKSRLTGLRTIRQNLAFGRTPLPEAQTQADLLLVGGTIAQVLQPQFNELVVVYERFGASLAKTENSIGTQLTLAETLTGLNPEDPLCDKARKAAITAAENTGALLEDLETIAKHLRKKSDKFFSHCRFTTYMSQGSVSGLDPYFDQLRKLSDRVTERLKGIKATAKKAVTATNTVTQRPTTLPPEAASAAPPAQTEPQAAPRPTASPQTAAISQ